MKLRYIIAFAVSIYALFVAAACGSKNSSTNEVTTLTCPAGTAYYNAGHCYGPNGQIIGNYSDGLLINQETGYLAETHRNRNLSITDGAVFSNFLEKAHGVCNRAHINGGKANCNSWLNGYFMVGLRTFANLNNSMQLTFFVDYRANSNFNYSYQLPSIGELLNGMFGVPNYNNNIGAMLPGFQVEGVTSLINSSKGFEVRAYGAYPSAGNRSLIQIQVTNGKILDNPLNFKLFFEGKQMASGSFYRCINPTCQ